MDALIHYLAKALVDRPDQVEVRAASAGEAGTIYELKVAPEDIGKVIGRDGRTVHAIRTLVSAAALKKGEKVRLEIIDDRRPASPTPAAPAAEPGA